MMERLGDTENKAVEKFKCVFSDSLFLLLQWKCSVEVFFQGRIMYSLFCEGCSRIGPVKTPMGSGTRL